MRRGIPPVLLYCRLASIFLSHGILTHQSTRGTSLFSLHIYHNTIPNKSQNFSVIKLRENFHDYFSSIVRTQDKRHKAQATKTKTWEQQRAHVAIDNQPNIHILSTSRRTSLLSSLHHLYYTTHSPSCQGQRYKALSIQRHTKTCALRLITTPSPYTDSRSFLFSFISLFFYYTFILISILIRLTYTLRHLINIHTYILPYLLSSLLTYIIIHYLIVVKFLNIKVKQ